MRAASRSAGLVAVVAVVLRPRPSPSELAAAASRARARRLEGARRRLRRRAATRRLTRAATRSAGLLAVVAVALVARATRLGDAAAPPRLVAATAADAAGVPVRPSPSATRSPSEEPAAPAKPAPATASVAVATPTDAVAPPASPATATAPVAVATPELLSIPDVGIEAPLVALGGNPDGSIRPPDDPWSAGWFADGPEPGEPGTSVIAGHVDTTSGPAVFHRLAEVRAGALVTVRGAGGASATYRVEGALAFHKDGVPPAVYEPTPEPSLRLITCAGPFDRRTGHYEDNLVLFATIVAQA